MTGGRDLEGRRIGGYRVLRELARGGMGVVYEVEREETGGRFALKTLLPALGQQDPELLARFVREARLAARLDHPHVVRTHAADLEGRTPWLVQDLLPGGSLADLLRARGGRLPVDEAVALGRKVALGLAHAHERGVLHRDVKPTNVLLDDDGEPRLVDFGLARRVDGASRLSLTGQVLGSPAFMAPEQALGDPVDPRTDVYGVGALLYTLLAGDPPFRDTGTLGVLEAVISRPPPPLRDVRPDVPPALEEVVLRALAKKPAERYPDAAALAAALADAATREPAPRRRGALVPGLAAAAALSAIAAVAALAAARPSARPAPPTAPSSAKEDPAPADAPVVPPPREAPRPDWRATLGGPATYELSWRDQSPDEDNRLSLVLAQEQPTIVGDQASVAAVVSALQFTLRMGPNLQVEFDSSQPGSRPPPIDGVPELIEALLAARIRFSLDLRTGAVGEVSGLPEVRTREGHFVFVDPAGRAVELAPVAARVAMSLNDHALRSYLENLLHVLPDRPERDAFTTRTWAAPSTALSGERRVRWSGTDGVLRGELVGDATVVPGPGYRLSQAQTRVADVRVESTARVIEGRIERSELTVGYIDAGQPERPRRDGTFTFVLHEPRR